MCRVPPPPLLPLHEHDACSGVIVVGKGEKVAVNRRSVPKVLRAVPKRKLRSELITIYTEFSALSKLLLFHLPLTVETWQLA